MKTQHVLILQHSKKVSAGSSIDWLTQNNIPFKIHSYERTPEIQPSLDEFSSVLICGGGMNVDEDHLFPWLKEEKKLIEHALKKQMKMVGLCLGAQLIAEVLGARVQKNHDLECGWHDVDIKTSAHFMLSFSAKKLRAFQWHGYTFETPLTAKKFASNEATPNQGFIYQDNVVCMQFHPEATKPWIEQCLNEPLYPTGPYCQTKSECQSELELQSTLQNWYHLLLTQLWKNK